MPYRLAAKFRARDFSRGARDALLDFVGRVAYGGKQELAAWLSGPYQSLVAHAAVLQGDSGLPPPRRPGRLRELDVRALLVRTRNEVVEALREASEPAGTVTLGFDAQFAGDVLRCEDVTGEVAFLPCARPGMHLTERVLSLAAADSLVFAEDYETHLAICGRCDEVAFDAVARGRGVCRRHAASGIEFSGGEREFIAVPERYSLRRR